MNFNYFHDITKFTLIPNDNLSHCFACGEANSLGLQLKFYTDKTYVFTKYKIQHQYAGWSNLTHGGILATIADETIAWTGIYLKQNFILTKNIQITYLRPVNSNEEILSVGKISSEISKKEIVIECQLFNSKGEVCNKSSGTLVLFPKEKFLRMGLVSKEFIERFSQIVFQE